MPGPARTRSGYPGISIRRALMDGRNKCGHDVIVVASLAACSGRSYISAETEPRPTIQRIGASQASKLLFTSLPRLHSSTHPLRSQVQRTTVV